LANLFAEYEIAEGLSIKTSGNVDMGDSRNFSFNGTTTGTRGVGLYKNPFSSLYQSKYSSWVNENLLNYGKSFNDHSFDVIIGFTAQKYRQDYSTINGSNYEDDKVRTLNAATTISASSGVQEWGLLSYLARVNYDYQAKYLLSASIRRDGSSRFGQERRWGNFPSVSVGWNISEEDFMAETEAISLLKLRASYGISGNFNIGNYSHIPTISGSNYVFGNNIAAGRRVDNLADRNLGWETNKQLNLGLDLNLFSNRINISYNYYNKITSDLLFNVRVPRASGFSNIQTNIGELEFWGHEFSVNTSNIRNDNFTWTTDFNISFDQNEVISMGTSTSSLITGPGSGLIGGSHITTEGQPVGMLYGMIHEGVYINQADFDSSPQHTTSQVGTAKFQDTNGDGIITVGDATIIGNPHPDFIFGLTNMMEYKNFDLSMTISGTYGNDILRGGEQTLTNLDGVFNVLSNVSDRWRSPEDPGSGRYGSLAAGSTYLERDLWGTQFLYDGSFLKVNNITLGYRFAELDSNSFLKDLRIYGSVQNVHTFTNYPGSNPEVSLSSASTGRGIDGGSYPVPRTFTLGVNVGF
jgi:TonB-linked SusC/RagA family outer membrane protein